MQHSQPRQIVEKREQSSGTTGMHFWDRITDVVITEETIPRLRPLNRWLLYLSGLGALLALGVNVWRLFNLWRW